MRSVRTGVRLPAALLLAGLLGAAVHAQDKEGEKGGGNDNPQARAPTLPGFVYVPPGLVHPGCTWKDLNDRVRGNPRLKQALQYDVWGNIPAELLQIPGFLMGRFEVTNGQWKHYLDQQFRREHECTGQDTLESLADKYVKFRDQGVKSEWAAIFALNAIAVRDAIVKLDRETAAAAAQAGEQPPAPRWNPQWKIEDPDPQNNLALSRVNLPKGLKLTLYAHRVPRHWYGWCKLSHLSSGREYCDISKPPAEAFTVPDNELYNEDIRKLRAKDFATHPVRDLSPREILQFADWAGCSIASEYEWERSARSERPNTEKYTFAGPWDHNKQLSVFAWSGNVACANGPIQVDDESVHHGDSPFGSRHMIGNVWELTRTFFDFHPRVVPKPPEPDGGIFNFVLTAKGGSWGDQWAMTQISTRSGFLGTTLDLSNNNRAASLGFRLTKHPQPGYDLLLHSVLRMSYESGRAAWMEPLPHAYAMRYMGGVEEIHIEEAKPPYVHVKRKAAGIAFVPLWVTDLDTGLKKSSENRIKQGRAQGRDFAILGILRSDLPLRGGVKLSKGDAEKLIKDRVDYKKIKEAYDRQQKSKKKRKKKKKGEEEEPIVLPPKPPDPDRFELALAKNEKLGLWRENTIPPGEWLVVYWYGFIGLANKTKLMPPDAIFMLDARKDIKRERRGIEGAKLTIEPEKDLIRLLLTTEEQYDIKRHTGPPDQLNSEMWALCEVDPMGWRPRKRSKYVWRVKVDLPVEKGALAKHKWNQSDDR